MSTKCKGHKNIEEKFTFYIEGGDSSQVWVVGLLLKNIQATNSSLIPENQNIEQKEFCSAAYVAEQTSVDSEDEKLTHGKSRS